MTERPSFAYRLSFSVIEFALLFAIAMVATQPAQAQTFSVLHSFTGGAAGENPAAGVTVDQAGNLYGTTAYGGIIGYENSGTAYKLRRSGSNWFFDPIVSFSGGLGGRPLARVMFGPEGLLYGTTDGGGTAGVGVVYKLTPPPTACGSVFCQWTQSVLYNFEGGPDDGIGPYYGDLVFDQAGNIYGTTVAGGSHVYGTVFELSPSGSGWTETILHNFGAGNDGVNPYSNVIFDADGNLYSTTGTGGAYGSGTIFELVRSTGWTENILYSFQGQADGGRPMAGLVMDQSGNLYGATSSNGNGGGTVFELSPSGGSWTLTTLHSFTGGYECGPYGTLALDAAGSLYGATYCDGANNAGNIFKLTNNGSGWTYSSLYDFTGGSDGRNPIGRVVLGTAGSLYGTTYSGGADDDGVVWEVTP